MSNSTIIRKAIDSAGSQFVSVQFVKQDGSERTLTFNPRDFNEIKGTGHTCTDPNIFRVRDIKLNAWRSFDARRTLSIRVNGVITKLDQE